MASRNYKYYQPNDKDLKDQYGDCVVRALTKVMSKTWMQVFDDLISYAKELQCMPNGKQCYESYLKENGFTYHGISNKKGSKRPTVDRFAKDHKSGIFFLNVANHLWMDITTILGNLDLAVCMDIGKKNKPKRSAMTVHQE